MTKMINQKFEFTLDAEYARKFLDVLNYCDKETTPSDLMEEMIDFYDKYYQEQLG